jgi:hypothetical protein
MIGVDGCSLKVAGAFFDIVDFDEGTCGRRRLRLGSFRLYDVGKSSRSHICPSYPLRLTMQASAPEVQMFGDGGVYSAP